MAVLTAKTRREIPKSRFAGPHESYPVEDKAHARDAKARASEEEHKGRLSKSEEAHIDSKANAVLRGGHRETHREPPKSHRGAGGKYHPRPERAGWGTAN